MTPASTPPEPMASRAVGAALAGGTRLLSAARQRTKPLHPAGTVLTARLHRHGVRPTTGVAWLDEPGTEDAIVRVSRALGLPTWLPDVHGLAIRVRVGDDWGDVLLADTGWRGPTRFLLRAGRHARGPMTTLLPYRSPSGPLVLGARSTGADAYELCCAVGVGAWRPFATLVLDVTGDLQDDEGLRFDPLLHELPGLPAYDWVRRLREPAYATARAGSPQPPADAWDPPGYR